MVLCLGCRDTIEFCYALCKGRLVLCMLVLHLSESLRVRIWDEHLYYTLISHSKCLNLLPVSSGLVSPPVSCLGLCLSTIMMITSPPEVRDQPISTSKYKSPQLATDFLATSLLISYDL